MHAILLVLKYTYYENFFNDHLLLNGEKCDKYLMHENIVLFCPFCNSKCSNINYEQTDNNLDVQCTNGHRFLICPNIKNMNQQNLDLSYILKKMTNNCIDETDLYQEITKNYNLEHFEVYKIGVLTLDHFNTDDGLTENNVYQLPLYILDSKTHYNATCSECHKKYEGFINIK